MTRNYKGQEAIEFILISILVFFGGLFAIMTLGSKMADFFTSGSSFAQVANQKANVISANNSPNFQTALTTELENENRTTVAGYEALKNPDGSISININDQVVNLEPEDLELVDTVFETTGSDGIELINAIVKVINENKSTDGTDVPLEISFGQGTRVADITNGTAASYTGLASVNTMVVKTGDKVLIIQKDQTCDGTCAAKGTYTIETTINGTSFTSSKVTADLNGSIYNGTYSGSVDKSKGIALDGYFELDSVGKYYWDINFDELKQL